MERKTYTRGMALEKKYDETPLQVLTDKETRARVRRLAQTLSVTEGQKVSQAEVMRRILAEGLPIYEKRHGVI